MEMKELRKDIAQGFYASPAVKVMEFRTSHVLCGSITSPDGETEGLETEDGNW